MSVRCEGGKCIGGGGVGAAGLWSSGIGSGGRLLYTIASRIVYKEIAIGI